MHLHFHTRKRAEPYPARKAHLRLLDSLVFAAGILGPIMAIPQIALIYTTRDASGISPFTWAAWAAMNIIWIVYGWKHREPPITITYTLWFVCNSLVFVGALLYG